MPFKLLLSPKARAELASRRALLRSLYELDDQELAGELERLVHEARLERPEMTPTRVVYDSNFLWFVLPEVVRRLTGGPLPEQDTMHLARLAPREFRRLVGLYLRNMSRYDGASAWAALTNEACNGNPVVFALDRLCAGTLGGTNDAITRSIEEIARVRGTPYNGVWTPAVMVD